jgi:uncharacterized protein (DUF488 family)
MDQVKLFTIGFTQRSAKDFFTTIKQNDVRKIIDVRLNNTSQMAGFTKRSDLGYFLENLCGCKYVHRITWAPTQDILDAYRGKAITWNKYKTIFLDILYKRQIETETNVDDLNYSCLLCSEYDANACHRRLVAEYLQTKFSNFKIVNL